jgi:hypothetical protein
MAYEPHLLPEPGNDEAADYFVDLIEQLAERARELGEFEVAVHLDATAKARRCALEQDAL